MAALNAIPETRAAAVEIYSMAATDPLLPLEIVLSSRREPSNRKYSLAVSFLAKWAMHKQRRQV